MTSTVHWDVFLCAFSVNKTQFNGVILFHIKFGTKHASWEHYHCCEDASY